MKLDALRGGLIVSVQAWKGSATDDPAFIAAMAQAAQDNGAAGVRVEGAPNLRAVRARVGIPVIGLVKREHPGFEPYITACLDDVAAVLLAGADAVAFDATERVRPGGATVAALVAAIHAGGRAAMADCATVEDALAAAAAGADMLATTLRGYTPPTRGCALPALDVVEAVRSALPAAFVVCEGGVRRPEQVAGALAAGADAVVVGSAITNVDWLVREFAGAATRVR